MRIPFRILRYPPKQTRFGVILERYIPRLNEIYTFPNMGAYYSTRRQSLWTGLELPPPRYPVILLPYFTGDSDHNRTHGRGGLDVRYIAGDPLTALLTVKPDFRNIAADVARVDFSYTEKVFVETRPFFQEGSEFLPGRAVFYSQRVQELNAGLKAFGTLGDWRLRRDSRRIRTQRSPAAVRGRTHPLPVRRAVVPQSAGRALAG